MHGIWQKIVHRFGAVACLAAGLTAVSSPAQGRERLEKTQAPLVVDGEVRQVFRSARQGRTDYVVLVLVQRAEGRRAPQAGARLAFPGPGDVVYIHVTQQVDQAGRKVPGESHTALPDERGRVRAYLTPREEGGWEGAFPDWFDATSDRALETDPEASLPSAAEKTRPRPAASSLGMTTESLKIENRLALRVTSVARGGAAQKAGLEEGDLIIGADGAALPSPDRIEELARKGDAFSLIVVDVNTGKGAQVAVTPQPRGADETAALTPAQPPKVSLGLSAEAVKLGSRSALKVTRVEPASAAAKAGLEVGDVVVAANGVPTTGPELLLSALRKSGPVLKLTVRNSRTGKDVDVDVPLSGAKGVKSLSPTAERPLGPASANLGAVTELTFHDDEFAVKVTEVETESPAARAGLLPGALILAANGKPVLHPNELNDAVRQSGGTLKLTVLDPITGEKTNVDVKLGK